MREPLERKAASFSPYEVNAQSQIIAAFEVFDDDGEGIMDPENLRALVNGLGCVPSDVQLQELIKAAEDEDSGFTSLEKLLPILTKIIVNDKYESASNEELIEAFKILDEENLGALHPDYVKEQLNSDFDNNLEPDEMNTFLAAAVHPKIRTIYYKEFCEYLVAPVGDILQSGRKIREELYRARIWEE